MAKIIFSLEDEANGAVSFDVQQTTREFNASMKDLTIAEELAVAILKLVEESADTLIDLDEVTKH